jgi:hypothetical protein
MIPTYTKEYMIMNNIRGSKYFLPFDSDVKEDEILEKTMKLIKKTDIYEHKLYERSDSLTINEIEKEITMKCLYEGYEEYYLFSINFTVFLLNDNGDKKWMASIYIEHSYGGLLDQLIDLITMPNIIKSLKFLGIVESH